MLSWIKNLHTCKEETFSWHSELWLVLGPYPPQAQQECPRGIAIYSVSTGPCVAHQWQHLLAWSFVLVWDCWSSIPGCYDT